MKIGRIAIYSVTVLMLLCGSMRQAIATPIISVGSYTPSMTTPFVVPILISGAIDLLTFQFDLAFDPADVQVNLNCDPFSDPYCDLLSGPVTEGSFTSSGGMFQTFFIPGVVDNITGLLSIVAGAYVDLPPGPSGSGILAFVEFVTTPTGTGGSAITVVGGSTTNSVPEPSTIALLICAVLVLGLRRRQNP